MFSGAAKTVQQKGRGGADFGANYKIVPMSGKLQSHVNFQYHLHFVFKLDEQVLNKISCFQANGTKEDLVDVQHTLPDWTTFEVIGYMMI